MFLFVRCFVISLQGEPLWTHSRMSAEIGPERVRPATVLTGELCLPVHIHVLLQIELLTKALATRETGEGGLARASNDRLEASTHTSSLKVQKQATVSVPLLLVATSK